MQKKYYISAGILVACLATVMVFAHWGHGDEDAEKLGENTFSLDEPYIAPEKIDIDSLSIPTYIGIVTSDNYGSVYSAQSGVVASLEVQLGDEVKKWQILGSLSRSSNAPEMIGLIAERKTALAISQGKKNAAQKVTQYFTDEISKPNNTFSVAFEQKIKALDLEYSTRQAKIEAEIQNARAQNEAKQKTIQANKTSSQALVDASEQKRLSAEKELAGAIETSFHEIVRIFYAWQTWSVINNNLPSLYILTTNSQTLGEFEASFRIFLDQYKQFQKNPSQLFETWKSAEITIRRALEVLKFAISHENLSEAQLLANKKSLLELLSDEKWIAVLLYSSTQIQKEAISTAATGTALVSQAEADILISEQQTLLLSKELDRLNAEKQRDFAQIKADQFSQWLDIQKMLNEARRDEIEAEAEMTAQQDALNTVQWLSTRIPIYAPFSWTISRKNVAIGQAIEPNTPLFDIVGHVEESAVFIRSEVPVNQVVSIKKDKLISIALPGSSVLYAAKIVRIASSVNTQSQTVAFEAEFVDENPLPLWTQVRILAEKIAKNVSKIPTSAIFEEEGVSYVWSVVNNLLKKTKVEAIALNEEQYRYVTEGLLPDTLIVSNAQRASFHEGDDTTKMGLGTTEELWDHDHPSEETASPEIHEEEWEEWHQEDEGEDHDTHN